MNLMVGICISYNELRLIRLLFDLRLNILCFVHSPTHIIEYTDNKELGQMIVSVTYILNLMILTIDILISTIGITKTKMGGVTYNTQP